MSTKAPGEILELFRDGYLSMAETIDALDTVEGYVSVELLNIERAISDDLREQNAKLRKAASTPAVGGERLWCSACGTVTRDMLCDCNRWPDGHEMKREPHFVNYADTMQETAHEQAQQIDKLEAHLAAPPASPLRGRESLIKRAAVFIRTNDPFGDYFSEHDLHVLDSEMSHIDEDRK